MSKFLLAITQDEAISLEADQVANELRVQDVQKSANSKEAVEALKQLGKSPDFVIVDIGDDRDNTFTMLEEIASQCEPSVKAIVVGNINDLQFYRKVIQSGVIEYFVKPVKVEDIVNAFSNNPITQDTVPSNNTGIKGKAISFFAAASGDGSTTVLINTAYALAKTHNKSVVILDLDYQFGMVARNLDLTSQFGLRELIEQPEGTVDSTLVNKMIIKYSAGLDIISAPNYLHQMPDISSGSIANIVDLLKEKYDYVLIDLPHYWANWLAATFKVCDTNILVSQLWLKSITHSSRLLESINDMGINTDKISIVVNRSGSKMKEGITPSDYIRVCGKKISHFIANDTKTIANSENQGKPAVEISNSILNKQFDDFATALTRI